LVAGLEAPWVLPGVGVLLGAAGVTERTLLKSYGVPLIKICGVPSEELAPSLTDWTTPLAVSPLASVCTVTVLPIRLLAWSIESEADMAEDCVSEVNCAICDAISVSD
jgi:hypothetical protein